MKTSTNKNNVNSAQISSIKNDFVYAAKAQTSIMFEQPSTENPYVSKANYLHGYNVLELMQQKSFSEVLLLLFIGELPEPHKSQLFERLMIGLMNLGPRHPAVKAAMVAGVSKTNAEHLLPIGLSVLGGADNGAKEVEQAVLFLQNNINNSVDEVVKQFIDLTNLDQNLGENHPCPGFGNSYGSIDEYTSDLANNLITSIANNEHYPYLMWAQNFSEKLAEYDMGWLKTGLAAAVFCELGIAARESIGLYQLLCAPGIFAHGVEQTHNPITSIPMLSDEQHVYTYQDAE